MEMSFQSVDGDAVPAVVGHIFFRVLAGGEVHDQRTDGLVRSGETLDGFAGLYPQVTLDNGALQLRRDIERAERAFAAAV